MTTKHEGQVKFVMRKAPMAPTFAVVELKTSTDIAWFYGEQQAKEYIEFLNGDHERVSIFGMLDSINMRIKIIPEDVKIEPLPMEMCECGNEATHIVLLDIRNAGSTVGISSKLCKLCAEDFAKQVKDSL